MFKHILYACGEPHRDQEFAAAAGDLARRLHARLTVVSDPRARERSEAALRLACGGGVDMILARAGVSRLPACVAPSAAATLLRRAACPVWTMHPGHGDFSKILCAVDHTAAAQAAVDFAADLARSLDASVTLLHAVPYADDSTMAYMHDPEPPILCIAEARRHLYALAETAGVDGHILATRGAPRPSIARALKETGAGLLILGRSPGGSGRMSRHFAGRTDVLMQPLDAWTTALIRGKISSLAEVASQ